MTGTGPSAARRAAATIDGMGEIARCLFTALPLLGALAAQDPGAPCAAPDLFGVVRPAAADGGGTARFTLWVAARDEDLVTLRDEVPYLQELQRRYGDRGVRIALALPPAVAEREAAKRPAFAVVAAELERMHEIPYRLWLGDKDGEWLVQWPEPDGIADVLEAAVAGRLGEVPFGEINDLIPSLLVQVADGGDYRDPVAHCVEHAPRSGRAHALAVLEAWWCRGDYAAARAAFGKGVQALGGEALPMVVFADLVLRGDPYDPLPPRQLAVALAPAAALASDGPFTQLALLRAQLRAGQDKLAGRTIARLPRLCEGSPVLQSWFADALMAAPQPIVHRDLAERALAAADLGATRIGFGLRYHVAARCGDGPEELAKVLEAYLKSEDVYSGGLNNDAWYLMVQPTTMGRMSTFPLALAERMAAEDTLSAGTKDTVALAKFVGGKLDEAVELQTEATREGGDKPTYVARRDRFRNAKALLAREAADGRDEERGGGRGR